MFDCSQYPEHHRSRIEALILTSTALAIAAKRKIQALGKRIQLAHLSAIYEFNADQNLQERRMSPLTGRVATSWPLSERLLRAVVRLAKWLFPGMAKADTRTVSRQWL